MDWFHKEENQTLLPFDWYWSFLTPQTGEVQDNMMAKNSQKVKTKQSNIRPISP
jgi:hypothetical protein